MKTAAGNVKETAWTGGDGEAWDLTPKLLYAAETVAAVSGDEELKKLADGLFSAFAAAQTKQGDFAVKAHREWTPRAYAARAVLKHYEISRDKNDLKFLRDFFKYVYNEFDSVPLRFGARLTALELLPPLYATATAFPEPFLSELAEKIKARAFNFAAEFSDFKRRKPYSEVLPARKYEHAVKHLEAAKEKLQTQKRGAPSLNDKKLAETEECQTDYENFLLYGGAGLAAGVRYLFFNDKLKTGSLTKLLENVSEELRERHGNATGVPSSEPVLSGVSATAGISAESAAEWAEALSAAFDKIGQAWLCDRLEALIFNSISAAFAENFSLYQAYQQPNQIFIGKKIGGFYHGQGNDFKKAVAAEGAPLAAAAFAEFTERLCYTSKNALAFPMYAPCSISAEVGGIKYKISETTDYPFKNKVKLTFDAITGSAEIKLFFRVPTGTYLKILSGKDVLAEGGKGVLEFKLRPKPKEELDLVFSVPISVCDNPDDSVSFYLGTLLLAADVKPNGAFSPSRECSAKTLWNFAPVITDGKVKAETAKNTTFSAATRNVFSHENPPAEITVSAKQIVNWTVDADKGAGTIPSHPKPSESTAKIKLVPYAAAPLRITHFPKISFTTPKK